MNYYLGLGSNMGSRLSRLGSAIEMLAAIGFVKRISPVFETRPVGMKSEFTFLNLALEFESGLHPQQLLTKIIDHETGAGRKRPDEGKQDRPIDIDILLAGDQIIADDNLVVPHVAMHRRAFILQPLLQIAANARHPVLGQTIRELAAAAGKAEIINQVATPSEWRNYCDQLNSS